VTSSTPDPDLSNNEDTISTPLAEEEEADLAVEKVASASAVTAGGQVSYTLIVTNKGPHDGTGVSVTDPVPPELSVVQARPSQGSCDTTAGVRCDLGRIASGGSAQILLTANLAPDAHGTLTNAALVVGNEIDPDTTNNTSSATISVTPLTPQALPQPPAPLTPIPAPAQPASDLEIVERVDRVTSRPGQRLIYTLSVTNHGLDDAPDVQVTDSSSLGLKILSAHAAQGSCTVAHPIRCSLGRIKRDAGVSITVLAEAERTGTEHNTASVTSSNRDPDLSNNQSSAATDVLHKHRHSPLRPPPVTG
jgi:large repetitive protein